MNEIAIKEEKDDIIRSIINMQEQQAMALNQMASMVDAIRENIVTNMQFELEDAMMECIVRNSVTPTEYKRISQKMKNYTALDGNHIQDLYNERFKLLPIRN